MIHNYPNKLVNLINLDNHINLIIHKYLKIQINHVYLNSLDNLKILDLLIIHVILNVHVMHNIHMNHIYLENIMYYMKLIYHIQQIKHGILVNLIMHIEHIDEMYI